MTDSHAKLFDTLLGATLLPVVTLKDASAAPVLARILADAGFSAMEIVLRTPAALDALRAAAQCDADILVGAGTITTPELLEQAVNAGACFAVSPAFDPDISESARELGVPLIPGVATAGECQRAWRTGHTLLKFFPAEASGGVAWLQSMAGVYPQLRFCPTGGLHAGNLADYLALPNVPVAGGSWFVREADQAANHPQILSQAAREALQSALLHK